MLDVPTPQPFPFTYALCNGVLHLLSNYTQLGRDTIPQPPYIVIANHMSFLDTLVVGAAMMHNTMPITAVKYQGSFTAIILQRLVTPIWIEQNTPDRHSLKQSLAALEAGYTVGLSPEGTRSKTHQLQKGLEGAAFLVRRANVPVLPIGIAGTDHLLKKIRPRVVGWVGKPFRLPETNQRLRDILPEDTERLMCSIAALLPERYHGYYAGHPMIAEMAQIVR